MKRLTLAIALACLLLSSLARAGEIHPTGAVPTPTPSPITVVGEIPSTGATATQESSTVLTIILAIIDIVR